jgi:hypothetical protein
MFRLCASPEALSVPAPWSAKTAEARFLHRYEHPDGVQNGGTTPPRRSVAGRKPPVSEWKTVVRSGNQGHTAVFPTNAMG